MTRFIIILAVLITTVASTNPGNKIGTKRGHAYFYSHTVAEDLKSDNYRVTSTIKTETGEIMFSVPIEHFEFKNARIERHFHTPKFMDSKRYPKAKFKGTILRFEDINWEQEGSHKIAVSGILTIRGVEEEVTEAGDLKIEDDKAVVTSTFRVRLKDYGMEYKSGQAATNLAKEVDVTIRCEYVL
jgi:polyisoprenoid-binding protein YceI